MTKILEVGDVPLPDDDGELVVKESGKDVAEIIEEEDDTSSISSLSESESEDEGDLVVEQDFTSETPSLKNVLGHFKSRYGNIIAEFADVEIFVISLDGLLVELTSHHYLNWVLGGQTVVLAKQVDIFLHQLCSLGGKFKLVWFTALREQYEKDTVLRFIRSFMEVHVLQSKWANEVVEFRSPADPLWAQFLHELTPSLLMTSVNNFSEQVTTEDTAFANFLTSIAIDALSAAIPVVHFNGLVINISSVLCHRVEPAIVKFNGWDRYLENLWCQKISPVSRTRDLSYCKNTADFWVEVIKHCKQSKKGIGGKFEEFISAVLVSALVFGRLGIERTYLPVRNTKDEINKIKNRRALLTACSEILDTLNVKATSQQLILDDIWDGRYVLSVFDEIMNQKKILPLRLQKEFAVLHGKVQMKYSLPTDVEERLFNPPSPLEDLITPIVNRLLPTNCGLLKDFFPEFEKFMSSEAAEQDLRLFKEFNDRRGYHVQSITEEFTRSAEKLDFKQAKRKRKQQQKLSKWYEDFAQSLEGRGSSLLVDFSRKPLHVIQRTVKQEETLNAQHNGPQKLKNKESKKKKEPVKSKKELILEANKSKKNAKIIEDERKMITFAANQGSRAVAFLEDLLAKLDTRESRARCVYEQACRLLQDLEILEGDSNQELRRLHAVPLVGKLKDLFSEHWECLDEKQKAFVRNTWDILGFAKKSEHTSSRESKLSLGMNMLYYQLAYGGQLIDIESDPQKDDRVTGFRPDAWQREMLDAVDRKQSAVIIAPTSAGKTFVSFYCIEGVLRNSDDDVVVYVSPSKALLNQVCGSLYARFRNKTMSGGKALFGVLTMEYSDNAMNCQVLVTVPECFEKILLSCEPSVRAFASKIKYAIFDEVHCISASPEADIWEHLLLLIQCPFLALSATIANPEALHKWLETTENSKTRRQRKVALIVYNERYSELELYIQRLKLKDADETLTSEEAPPKTSVLQQLMPYGVFKPMKLAMFGIPADQQLTAKQILELYRAVSDVDPSIKENFEPCKFYKYREGGDNVWLTRARLRELENALKKHFINWLETDADKLNKVLARLGENVEKELFFRSHPFDQLGTALKSIVDVVLELRQNEQLPAICFSDDRSVCEKLAVKLFDYFEKEQLEFEASPEFKNKFEIKDEEKLMKIAKRKRDSKEVKDKIKTKKGKRGDDEENAERVKQSESGDLDDLDPLAGQRLRLKNVLAKYRLHKSHYDEELVSKIKERLKNSGAGRHRESTKLLLRLFERGIAFHHEGLAANERGTIEILFRCGYLGMLFSTSTLALGINMPCKTVLFGIDTPYLTPLQFRQMSGRAGRRGFDHSGNVIFMSIPTAKMRRLLTASMATLRGNLPFTTTYVLRLLSFVYKRDITAIDTASETAVGIERRTKAALALLKNPFILHTQSRREELIEKQTKQIKSLEKQTKLFTIYSVQLLRWLDLLDAEGIPKGLAPIVTYLCGQEPGNLVFVYLLQKGVFHKLCEDHTRNIIEVKRVLVMIFAHLFTNLRLPLSWDPDDKTSYPSSGESTVFLGELPNDFKDCVDEYNKKVEELWSDFLTLVSTDDTLRVQKNVYSLTGNANYGLRSMFTDIVRPCHDEFLFDEGLFPTRLKDLVDYRGRKVHRNAYAYDFWIHGSKKLLYRYNNIEERNSWLLIRDFNVTLEKISEALSEVSKSTDVFTKTMMDLSEDYDKKFRSAFNMKKKFYAS